MHLLGEVKYALFLEVTYSRIIGFISGNPINVYR